MYIIWMYDGEMDKVFEGDAPGLPFRAENESDVSSLVRFGLAHDFSITVEKVGE